MTMLNDFKILAVTYNVNGKSPGKDFSELLGFRENFYGVNELPDLYAIGFQEAPFNPLNIIYEDAWVTQAKDVLVKWDYVKLKQIRMRGILLVIFTKRHLLTEFRNVQTAITSVAGPYRNKAAVTIRMSVSGVSLCVVNTHLPPHDHNFEERIKSYNIILEDQKFIARQATQILSHDYVIWMGDLNFRIDKFTAEEINEMSSLFYTNQLHKRQAIEHMQTQDQLMKAQQNGQAFSEFEETRQTFMPTYKYLVNSSTYDLMRKPAWTDRILFRCIRDAYSNVTLSLAQAYYSSHENYFDSDHKPVSSLFTIKVFNKQAFEMLGYEEPVKISFLPVRQSSLSAYQYFDVWFTISSPPRSGVWDKESINKHLTDQDWIGLYDADFTSFDQYVTYAWVNPRPQVDIPPHVRDEVPLCRSTSELSEDVEPAAEAVPGCDLRTAIDRKSLWFKVTISDHSRVVPNTYRLVYVSQLFNNVLGMSAPFEIKFVSSQLPHILNY